MSLALNKENFLLHKLHSLSGVIPVGYYLVQHLTLNTFSLAGPEKFNAILAFFGAMPIHFLIGLKLVAIWIPLIFHAVYGLFIASRAKFNYQDRKYQYRENRYYTWQRISGIAAFFFLIYHMATTSVAGLVYGEQVNQYQAWATKLTSGGTYIVLAIYLLGIVACTYHFSYGIWSFCIRWGITISERAQNKVWKVAQGTFVALTLLGFAALAGFYFPLFQGANHGEAQTPATSGPVSISAPLNPR